MLRKCFVLKRNVWCTVPIILSLVLSNSSGAGQTEMINWGPSGLIGTKKLELKTYLYEWYNTSLRTFNHVIS